MTFGSTAFLTITIAVVLAVIAAKMAGQVVADKSRASLRDQVIRSIQTSSGEVADVISRRIENLQGLVTLQSEVVRDRIVGYPEPGWEDDQYVPFLDILSGQNQYPLQGIPPIRDWEVNSTFISSSATEDLQDRATILNLNGSSYYFDTSRYSYRFQGNCDPSISDPHDSNYYPNCTEANNNVDTGGVIQPVATNKFLAEKSAAIGVFMKPLWESHPEVLVLGMGFHNSGAGAMLDFPAFKISAASSYTSQGCEWMAETNPLTREPYGTSEEIARCHPRGTHVDQREFNPLERGWCADQALHPLEVRMFGPYQESDHGVWLMTFGTAVFDRM